MTASQPTNPNATKKVPGKLPAFSLALRNERLAAGRVELRNELWPDIPEAVLWNRKTHKGFATVPRTLSIVLVMLDSLTKGTPVSSTYLDLWCRMYDEGYVKLDKPQEMALASGFTTARGPQIWATRLDLLQQHGFIMLATGPQGPRSFALIRNPYLVLKDKRKEIDSRLYNSFLAQAIAIGAKTSIPDSPSPTLPQILPPPKVLSQRK